MTLSFEEKPAGVASVLTFRTCCQTETHRVKGCAASDHVFAPQLWLIAAYSMSVFQVRINDHLNSEGT